MSFFQRSKAFRMWSSFIHFIDIVEKISERTALITALKCDSWVLEPLREDCRARIGFGAYCANLASDTKNSSDISNVLEGVLPFIRSEHHGWLVLYSETQVNCHRFQSTRITL